jgi:AraC family transcriptional regulator
MSLSIADTERRKRINRVLDYILAHPDQDISLQTLAGLAHYSPFHLQKIFKETVGESPKQYILKLRLETALHRLIIHPQKTIQEIAADCNFPSPASFTKAIKNYFGHPPEQLRQLPHKEKMKILHARNPTSTPRPGHASTAVGSNGPVDIRTIKTTTIKGIYLLVPFDNPDAIQQAFAQLTTNARANDWPTTHLYGILTPHQRNSYKAFLPCPQGAVTDPFTCTDIPGGKSAVFTIKGDLKQTNKAIHYFYQRWLPDNGYKIAGIAGFETFSGDPAATTYYQLERHIHIPIEPIY